MIRRALQNFMYGRYGTDQLNIALLVLYLVLYLVSAFARLEVCTGCPWWCSFCFSSVPSLVTPPAAVRRMPNFSRWPVPFCGGSAFSAPHTGTRSTATSGAPTAASSCGSPGARERSPSPAATAAPASRSEADPIRFQAAVWRPFSCPFAGFSIPFCHKVCYTISCMKAAFLPPKQKKNKENSHECHV